MRKESMFFTMSVLLFLMSGCISQQNQPQEEETMQLTSSAFQDNEKIPIRYTCDGVDINPPLSFKDVPPLAKTLVLIMDDPDIPDFVKEKFNINMWDHWIVFNIPVTTTEIKEGESPSGLLGKNTAGKNAYGGPCPPDREHRYIFTLYALNTILSLPEGSTKKEVKEAMEGHIVAETTLIGRYQRQ